MVTFAQAQERAERWVNGSVAAYQHREVRVREFELGFVAWAEDRADGPSSDGGALRLVIARDSGDSTLWPGLPVDEIVRIYQEEYGAMAEPVDDTPPPQPRDLESTSFLLTPPEWLQQAADQLGIPDRRSGRPPSAAGAASGPAAPPAVSPAPGTPAPGTPVPGTPTPGTPEPGTPAPGTGSMGGSYGGAAPPTPATPATPAMSTPPPGVSPAYDPTASSGTPITPPRPAAGASPWDAADTSSSDADSVSVATPHTVFAPPISGTDEEPRPAPTSSSEAKTTLMPDGSGLARTTVAPVLSPDDVSPQGPGGQPYPSPAPPPSTPPPSTPSPGTPPPGPPPGAVHHAATMLAGPGGPPPGVPAAPAMNRPPGAPPPPGAPGVPGAGSHGGGHSRGGGSPGAPPPPGAPGVPGAGSHGGGHSRGGSPGTPPPPPGAPGTPGVPGSFGGNPSQGGSSGGGAVHHAATMLAGPEDVAGAPTSRAPVGSQPSRGGGPAVPHPPGVPGTPGQRGGAPGTPPPPGPPGGDSSGGGVHHAATMLASPSVGGPQPPGSPGTPPGMAHPGMAPGPGASPGMGPAMAPGPGPGMVPGPGPGMGPGAAPPPTYGYPQPPGGQPTVGPGYMAVLRYRAPDGSEQQIIRRSAPGIPHPEWQILYELRALNVPPQQVLELHTELESCDLPGGYCAQMIRETWPQVRITHTASYGRDHASRQQGVHHLLEHHGELHQVADGPARPAPVRVPLPPPHQLPPIYPVPPQAIGDELLQAFGPQAIFRFDQRAVARQGVPEIVGQTLVWAGLPVDFGPFFWAQAQPGRPVPTLAELAAERGAHPSADAGSYLVMGNDFGRQLCVQYGTAHIVAVPYEGPPGGGPSPAQFVNTGLPEFARSLALLGRMWRLRYELTPEQAGRWTVDFQSQLVALDPAALASPENWWSVLLEQMWDGLL